MKFKPTLSLHYYLLLAFVSPFMPAQAQKPSIGIKAGIVISNLSIRAIDPVEETNSKTSLMLGAFVHIHIKGRFSIRPGVEYVSKGAFADNYNIYSYDNKIQFGYLDFPINFLHEFRLTKNKWLAGGGPVIGFLLNKGINPGYATTDIGVNLMAAYEWAIGASIALNFTQGLKNIIDGYNGGNVKNYLFGLTIGYRF